MNVISRQFTLLIAALLLASCGGGGGSDSAPDTQPPPQNVYTGLRSAASIDENTLPDFYQFIFAYVADAEPSAEFVSVAGKQGSDPEQGWYQRDILMEQVSLYVVENLAISFSDTIPEKSRAQVSEVQQCEGGGQLEMSGDINDDGTGSLSLNYVNCALGKATYNGSSRMVIHRFNISLRNIESATETYLDTRLTVDSKTFRLNGDSSIETSFSKPRWQKLTFDFMLEDEATSEQAMYENLVIETKRESTWNEASYKESIQGRVYFSELGYIDIETVSPKITWKRSGDPLRVEGEFEYTLTGANNSEASLLFEGDEVSLALDSDGNGYHEATIRTSADSLASIKTTPGSNNKAPIAVITERGAAITQWVEVGQSAELTARNSSDPDRNVLSVSWSIVKRPEGSQVALASPSVINWGFVPDISGLYEFELEVNDGSAKGVTRLQILAYEHLMTEEQGSYGFDYRYIDPLDKFLGRYFTADNDGRWALRDLDGSVHELLPDSLLSGGVYAAVSASSTKVVFYRGQHPGELLVIDLSDMSEQIIDFSASIPEYSDCCSQLQLQGSLFVAMMPTHGSDHVLLADIETGDINVVQVGYAQSVTLDAASNRLYTGRQLANYPLKNGDDLGPAEITEVNRFSIDGLNLTKEATLQFPLIESNCIFHEGKVYPVADSDTIYYTCGYVFPALFQNDTQPLVTYKSKLHTRTNDIESIVSSRYDARIFVSYERDGYFHILFSEIDKDEDKLRIKLPYAYQSSQFEFFGNADGSKYFLRYTNKDGETRLVSF